MSNFEDVETKCIFLWVGEGVCFHQNYRRGLQARDTISVTHGTGPCHWGHITTEVVQSELVRITRTDWKWEALVHDENSFLVAFPSDKPLQSMVDIGF